MAGIEPKIVVIVQARMSSRRLPGKVMLPLAGVPMLQRQLERLSRSRMITQRVVATTCNQEDDVIEALCRQMGVEIFRGSEDDVLDRYYRAAESVKADIVVRVTADCPMVDPALLDQVVQQFLQHAVAYASNVGEQPSYPNGFEVEVCAFDALATAWRDAQWRSEREHVTPYLIKHPELFPRVTQSSPINYASMRVTVDYAEDYAVVNDVFTALFVDNPDFSVGDVVSYIEKHPDVLAPNQHIQRNDGYAFSLANDCRITC